jgi:NAD+ diphosphatase
MTRSIFDIGGRHPEPSSLTAFAQNNLRRDVEIRADDCLEKAFAAEGVHAFAIAGDRLILKHDRQVIDPLFAPYELVDLNPDPENAVLLGYRDNGAPRLAVPVKVDTEQLPEHYKAIGARSLFREASIDVELQGEAAQAISLLHWNRTNQFCGKCGSPMEAKSGGYKRVCASCGHTAFPRTDPVVIMLVIDEENDRCLLGRSPHFPEGMYSALAGFVEPGETMENAVRRETFEESAIRVGQVRYYGSQPWPAPHSLMIGCYGRAENLDIAFDGNELEDCRWFTRDETEEVMNRFPSIISNPPFGAIAQRLMRDWLDWDG